MTKDDAAAERDWRRVCGAMGRHVIGWWRGKPIVSFPFSDYARPNHPLLDRKFLLKERRRAKDDATQNANPLRGLAKKVPKDKIHPLHPAWTATYGAWESVLDNDELADVEEFKHAVAGCVGEVLFCPSASPAFRRDLNSLKELWAQLPLPLQVPIRDLRSDPDRRKLASLRPDRQTVSTAVSPFAEHRDKEIGERIVVCRVELEVLVVAKFSSGQQNPPRQCCPFLAGAVFRFRRAMGKAGIFAYARIDLTTLPWTSVSR